MKQDEVELLLEYPKKELLGEAYGMDKKVFIIQIISEYCGASFTREKHYRSMCEKNVDTYRKRKHVQLGYYALQDFTN